MKGKISISRIRSTNPKYDQKIRITIEEADYTPVLDILICADKLGLALTGLACQECEIVGGD